MSHPVQPASYRAVFRLPGARPALAAATVGRLSYGTAPLALLFTAQSATGSFSVAGTVLGAYGLTSLSAPAKSRLIDRYGQHRALAPLGPSYAGALLAIAAFGLIDFGQGLAYVLLGALAGLLAPPLGPSMRAVWATLTTDPQLRQRAYGLDSIVEEIIYIVGPILAGTLIAWTGPSAALLVTAALAGVGTVRLASSAAAQSLVNSPVAGLRARPVERRHHLSRDFVAVLTAMLGIGLCLGTISVGVAGRASAAGTPSAAGYLLAALAFGSAIGALAWGARRHTRALPVQLTGLLTVVLLGALASAWASNLVVLAVALGWTGAAVGPAFVVSYLAADDLVASSRRTEATAWVNTISNLGSANGAAVAGVLVDHANSAAVFLTAAGGVALGITAVIILRVNVDR